MSKSILFYNTIKILLMLEYSVSNSMVLIVVYVIFLYFKITLGTKICSLNNYSSYSKAYG